MSSNSKTVIFSISFLLYFAVALLSCNSALAATVNLPQTGQSSSYFGYDDGAGMQGISWPNPRFTVNSSAPDNGDTITDHLSGLVWMRNAGAPENVACSGGVGCSIGFCNLGTGTWQEALNYVACLNGANAFGHNDWRLPNVNELESLINAGEPDTSVWLTTQSFSNAQAWTYWSSTTISYNTANGWAVWLDSGSFSQEPKTGSNYVLPVSGTSTGPAQTWKTGQTVGFDVNVPPKDDGTLQKGAVWPVPRFIVNADTTVTDNLTGLLWTPDAGTQTFGICTGGALTWQGALDYVACLNADNYLGFNDWRLPNKEELRSMIDYSVSNTALPSGHPFGLTVQNNGYWTSTSQDATYAYYVDLNNGELNSNTKVTLNYVWPVRSETGYLYGNTGISVSPPSYDFANVANGTQSSNPFTVTNTGTNNLYINTISITGLNSNQFLIQNDNCSNHTVAPSGTCSLTVTFSPSSAGYKEAVLSIPSNAPASPEEEALSGTSYVIDGACGTSNGMSLITAPSENLCSEGVPTAVSGSGPWTWTCQGAYGGVNSDCYAGISLTWTDVSTASISNALNGVAFGNGTYVVVGDTGTILTSVDGDTWVSRVSGTVENLRAVAFGNSKFVAVGDNGTILTSKGGSLWKSQTAPTASPLYGVTYADGIFVAVGFELGVTVITTSADGISWTDYSNANYFELHSAAFGGGRFAAVGYCNSDCWASYSQYSVDNGAEWISTIQANYGGYNSTFYGITYGNGKFVAVGAAGSVAVSADITSWTTQPTDSVDYQNAIAFGNGMFTAVGSNGSVISSAGGSNWTIQTPVTANELLGATYGNGIFVAVGASGTIVKSGAYGTQLPTLAVNKSGLGNVTADSGNINCGEVCSGTYAPNTSVILTATGYEFKGWTGGGCSGTGTCTVTMDASKTVTANFETPKLTPRKTAIGGNHVVAVNSDGSLWAWGLNYSGQLGDGTTNAGTVPVRIGLDNHWVSVAAGYDHSVGLKADGTLWTWGKNNYGQLGNGTDGLGTDVLSPAQIGSEKWIAVSAGRYHTIALKDDGTLWAWGSNTNGQLGYCTDTIGDPVNCKDPSVPQHISSTYEWKAVSAGGYHTMAIMADGSLWVWGSDANGQLGYCTDTIGDPANCKDPSVPEKVGTEYKWVSISAGDQHSVALKSDGTLWSWGDNTYGQLGSSPADPTVPNQIGAGTDWISVAAGLSHTLGLKANGTLWAWGDNGVGQLGDYSVAGKAVPVQVGIGAPWISVAAGRYSSLGLKADGTLWTWGDYNKLGDGSSYDKTQPVQISLAPDAWKAVSTGSGHTLALKADGSLWAWGNNYYGQVGDGSTNIVSTPLRIGTDNDWKAVSAGEGHSLAIKADGTLWAWGDNTYVQLGSYPADPTLPSQVGADTDWLSVSTGNNHSTGLKANGTLWAWGLNSSGQLGDGTFASPDPFPAAASLNQVFAISAGGSHTAAITSEGNVQTWGDNSYGQLATGDTTQYGTPQTVATQEWTTIATGARHTIAVKADGNLFLAGDNTFKQLGSDTVADPTVFSQISYKWKTAAAGAFHSMGIKSDGSLWTWGLNDYGQLGYSDSPVEPVMVGADYDWISIDGGSSHSAGIKADGTLWLWGDNSSGQIGNTLDTTTNTPRQLGKLFQVTVAKSGDGTGSVGCNPTCSDSYVLGTTITLTATPSNISPEPDGSVFTKWTGCNIPASGPRNICELTIAGDMSVTADFSAKISIAAAVDNTSLAWTTGGDADWSGQTSISQFGGDAAESGAITNGQSSWAQTTVIGPAQVSFWWKGSSGAEDLLRFYIDEAEKDSISGETDWTQMTYDVPAGEHALKWDYSKTNNSTSGMDTAWLDRVEICKGSVALSPPFASYPVDVEETGTIEVKAPWCYRWNASTVDSTMLSITSGATGTGNGTITYSVFGNDPTGEITVETKIFPVSRTGAGGPYNLTVTSSGPGIIDSCGTPPCITPYTENEVVAVKVTNVSGNIFSGWTNGCPDNSLTCYLMMNGALDMTAVFNTPLLGGSIQGKAINFDEGYAYVSTLADTPAGFNLPLGITTDSTNLFVVDNNNHAIRKIVIATGEVSLIAGVPGTYGANDGPGTAAKFYYPNGITIDSTGANLYVADGDNGTIRRIDISTGVVSTFIDTSAGFVRPYGITTDGTNLYVTDSDNHTIHQIVISSKTVTTIAGQAGTPGELDGAWNVAEFNEPSGITTNGIHLFVADRSGYTVRKIAIATGDVTTIAGLGNSPGSTDAPSGPGSSARFNQPNGITTDGTYLYVTDQGNHIIRRIVMATGAVTTLAGMPETFGSTGGKAPDARFNQPRGITTDGTDLYVADSANDIIRKIYTKFTLTVSTYGNGTITADGINCDASYTDCSEEYALGTSVTLTATPASGNVFAGWVGCDIAGGSQCTVTVDGQKTVKAIFAPDVWPGSALKFDGTGWVSVPDLISGNTTLTVEAWFRTISGGVILGYFNNAETSFTPAIYVGLDGLLRGEFWVADNGNNPITSNTLVNDGNWHHAALVGNVNTQSLYLDGRLVGFLKGTIDHLDMTNLRIGMGIADAWPSTPGSWFGFNGTIDEVRIWHVARTTGEIQAAMGHGLTGSESGLVGYWKFNEGFGDTAFDSTANYYNGTFYTLDSGVSWQQSEPVVFELSGLPSGDFVDVPFDITVTAKDASGNPVTDYAGTVHFTSSDKQAVLPADYSFTAGDSGSKTFSGAMFKSAGPQVISVTALTGPVGYWKFDEGSGINIPDSSGYGSNGTLAGSNPAWSTDVPPAITGAASFTDSYSLSFNGTDDFLYMNDKPIWNLSMSSFTFSGWLKPQQVTDQAIFHNGFGCGYCPISTLTIGPEGQCYWSGTSEKINFLLGTNTGSYVVTQTSPLTAGQWKHVAITYSGTMLTLYIDGVPEHSVPASGIALSNSGGFIGADPGCGGRFQYNGLMDDFRIYSRSLTSDEITSLAAGDRGVAAGTISFPGVASANLDTKTYTVTVSSSTGPGSLVQTISEIGSGNIIEITVADAITLGSTISIDKDVTIKDMVEPGNPMISGDGSFRIFYVAPGNTLNLDGLIVLGGYGEAGGPDDAVGSAGGGVYNNGGTVNISGCFFMANSAGTNSDGDGGAIYNYQGTVKIDNSAFYSNIATSEGGGICNYDGTVTISGSIFDSNQADMGGAIINTGTGSGVITIETSTLSNNSVAEYYNEVGSGGGLLITSGTVIVQKSSIINNTADGWSTSGAGIEVNGGEVTVENSTISGNTITGNYPYGGGLAVSGATAKATVRSSTIAFNSAADANGVSDGDNIYVEDGGIVDIGNSIVAYGANNCDNWDSTGTITDSGYNIDDGSSCSFSAATSLNNIDPKLWPLADNSGLTQTHALSSDSPAKDMGDCPDITTDQRSMSRPQNSICDIGAYEFSPMVTVSLTSSISSTYLNNSVTFTASLTDNELESYPTGTVTFKDNGSVTLGTVALDIATQKAALTTSSLSVSGHSITATYNGDSAFNSAVSNTLALNVGAILPSVTTSSVGNIAAISATGSGNVTSDGGATVTARGICWSITANPTTSNTCASGGTGTGIFNVSITGLSGSTTYHVRAYATNSLGTAYGSDVTFTTLPYTITPSVTLPASGSVKGGTINPATQQKISKGGSQTFTITPDTGYHIASVKVDGSSLKINDPSSAFKYTFSNVSADHTIEASFGISGYTVSASAGANGSIQCTPLIVQYGGSSKCTMTPDKHFEVADIKVNGTSVGKALEYTISNITQNTKIIVMFGPKTYNLTVIKTGEGSVTTATSGASCGDNCFTYNEGQTVTLSAKPAVGWLFSGWEKCDNTGGNYCMVTMDDNRTVKAMFEKNVPEISTPPSGQAAETLDFGSVKLGKLKNKTYKITNSGKGPLTITAYITGDNAKMFTVKLAGKKTIKSKGSYGLALTFKPKSSGAKSAALNISFKGTDLPDKVIQLTGEGK